MNNPNVNTEAANNPEVEEWELSQTPQLPDDPLLACLMMMTKHHQKPCSAEALKSGLPLVNNRLTPELFIESAERAGFKATLVKRPLDELSNLVLPAVLLLKNKKACVLLAVRDKIAVVRQPETSTTSEEIALKELAEQYNGYVLFIKPAFEFTDRANETLQQEQTGGWFWSEVFKSWPTYSEVLVASFLINCFALAVPLFVMNVYDRVVPNHAIDTLWVLVSGIAIVFIFDFVLKTLRGYFLDIAAKNVDVRLSSKIFQQVLGVRMDNRPNSVGAFANTVQSFESFRDFITSSTITVLIDFPFVLIYLAVIALLAGNLCLVPMFTIPLIIGVGYLLQKPMNKYTDESFRHAAEKQATLIESLSGIEAIKGTGSEGAMQKRWEEVVKAASRVSMKLKFVSNTGVNFAAFAIQLATVLMVIMGVYKITQGDLTTGALIASTILTGRALAPMSQVASLLSRYYQSIHALTSVDNIMNMPTDRTNTKNYLHRTKFEGSVDLENVSFTYPSDQVKALDDISISIKPGEKVGIIGRIGSGKTSLAKLLLRLYEQNNGSILIDGTDIQQIDPAELRHAIGYVPQDVVLLYGSVKDNIVMGATYVDDRDVLKAATVAGVDRFVRTHPMGYDMAVGERGGALSGGQRQCIAIARALLLNPPILVMDEPSNCMDDTTEAKLRTHLAEFSKDKTLVLVTHKISMLTLVDRLIVMDHGRIVADGKKEEVIKALSENRVPTAVPGQS